LSSQKVFILVTGKVWQRWARCDRALAGPPSERAPIFVSQRLDLHATEYKWPVISDMNKPTTVHVMFFGCDKQCVCECCFRRVSNVTDLSDKIAKLHLSQLFSSVIQA